MEHLGTQEIRTERLVLRRVCLEDAEAMHRNWTGDAEVTKYLTWPAHASVDVTRGFVSYLLSAYERPSAYEWCIVLVGESPEPIGMISAVRVDDDIAAIEVGYCLGRAWWGRGIMTEALSAVIDFFFTRVGANRIEARHDVRNPASGAVMRKCGMVYEGTHRQAARNNQGICDVSIAAVVGAVGGADGQLLPRSAVPTANCCRGRRCRQPIAAALNVIGAHAAVVAARLLRHFSGLGY